MYVYLGITWLAGLMAALFVPENILSASPALTLLVDVFSFAFPIKQFSSKSSFHDAAVVYYLVTLPSFPFLCRLTSTWLHKTPKRGVIVSLKLFFGAIVFGSLFPIWWFLFFGQDTRYFNLGSSRLDLGVFGMFWPANVAFSIIIICAIFKYFFIRKKW